MYGHEIVAERRRLNLTQEDLASRTGLSVRSIRNLESGSVAQPRPATIRILRAALGLDGDPPAPPAPRGPVRPMQLPLDIPSFTGRDASLATLDALLHDGPGPSSTVVVSAVAGIAGVGKTALAVHWAHRVADRFADGVLYVNLRGFDPGEVVVDPADAIRGFLEALAVPAERVPLGLDARIGLYRSLLAGRRVLLVLDNARDADQVRPLLPGAPGAMVVVTSRNQLAPLIAAEGARPVVLEELGAVEARELLRARVGEARLAAEPAAVGEIVGSCAGLPLALAMVAAHAVTRPSFPLTALAEELRAGRWGLAPGDIRTVFSWSYKTLPTPAARLFRLLGLHPGPDTSVTAAAGLAGIPVPEARTTLAQLAAAHLITEQRPGRYGFHDLLRVYAAELVSHDSDAATRGARRRLFDHYLHSAHSAGTKMQPQWAHVTPEPALGAVPIDAVPDQESARAWFRTERPVLMSTVHQAAATGFDTHAWQLAWALATFLAPQGLWQDQLDSQHVALEAAGRLGDRAGQALANRLLARAYTRTRSYDRAESHLVAGLALFAALGDRTGQAQTLHNYAELCDLTDRRAEALGHAEQALALYRAAGNRAGEARALNGVGWCHARLDDYERTIVCCTEALAVQQELGDRNGQAASLDSLGYAHLRLGRPAEAIDHLLRALGLFELTADRVNEALTLNGLGDAQDVAGDRPAARKSWRRAVDIFDELGSPQADLVREKLA